MIAGRREKSFKIPPKKAGVWESIGSLVARMLVVVLGLMILAVGVVLYLKAGLGTDSFTVFYTGVSKTFRISIGTAMQASLVALIVIVAFIDTRKLGIGTLMHGILVGFFIDLILKYFAIPPVSGTAASAAVLAGGIFSVGVGLGVYIKAGLGVGALDAAMLILHQKAQKDIKWVRIGIDFFLAASGFALGGTLGIGTVFGILFTGPVIELTLRVLDTIFPRSAVAGSPL